MRYAPLARTSERHARSWVGRHWPPGWCLAWILRQVYGLPANVESARDYLEAARAAGVLENADPAEPIPAGALVLWEGDPGHVAYSLGDGTVVTTDLPTTGQVGIVSAAEVAGVWGLPLAGYTLTTPAGVELTREPAPVPELRFITSGQLVGTPVKVAGDDVRTLTGEPVALDVATAKRDPTGRHRVVKVARATTYTAPGGEPVAHLTRGDVVRVLAQQTINGTSWLHLSGGTWIAAKEVRKP